MDKTLIINHKSEIPIDTYEGWYDHRIRQSQLSQDILYKSLSAHISKLYYIIPSITKFFRTNRATEVNICQLRSISVNPKTLRKYPNKFAFLNDYKEYVLKCFYLYVLLIYYYIDIFHQQRIICIYKIPGLFISIKPNLP